MLLVGLHSRQELQYVRNLNAQTPDGRTPATNSWVGRYPVEFTHVQSIGSVYRRLLQQLRLASALPGAADFATSWVKSVVTGRGERPP
jgi:hypothetical protein